MNLAEAQLRAFEDKDYAPFVALYNLVHNDHLSEAFARYFDSSRQGDYLANLVLASENRFLGAAWALKDKVSEVYLEFLLHPDVDTEARRGRLYQVLEKKLEPFHARSLEVKLREDRHAWMKFFLDKGFAETERQWKSRLDVQTFDPTPFVGALTKAEAAGISFKTLSDFAANEKTQRMLYDHVVVWLQDVPFAEPLEIWPFEVWLERYWGDPNRSPERVFLAFAADELVGMCELYQTDSLELFKNGLTAVSRDYRHKGIALSLKLKAIAYARAKGAKAILTTNHSINRPMLAINEALGFVKEPALVWLKKTLK